MSFNINNKLLTSGEYTEFIDKMKDAKYADGEFKPENSTFRFAALLLEYFTDCKPTYNYGKDWEFAENNELTDKILNSPLSNQFNSLVSDIESAQNNYEKQNIGSNGIVNSITKLLSELDVNTVLNTVLSKVTPEQLGFIFDTAKILNEKLNEENS